MNLPHVPFRTTLNVVALSVAAVVSAGAPLVASAEPLPSDKIFVVDPKTNTNAYERWWTANGACWVWPGLCN